MKTRCHSWTLWAAVLWLIVGGCVNLEKSYPDKRYFVLENAQRENSGTPKKGVVLLVSSLRVSPRYDGRSFIYRLSEANFESDFYNQFLVSPGALLSEEVRKAVSQAGVAEHVVGTASQLEPTHVLEVTVDALYGDFRDRTAPRAVLEMEFFLSKDSPLKAEIIARRRYLKSVLVNGGSAEALVRSWNVALNEILTAFVTDLKTVNF